MLLLHVRYIFPDYQASYACTFNYATLYCPNERSISLSSAHYGVYSSTCDDSCCTASDADCTESMQDTFPIDWQALVEECEGKSHCSVQNLGRAMSSCGGEPVLSDYVFVTYNCSGGTNILISC